jgi:hypothetical protein
LENVDEKENLLPPLIIIGRNIINKLGRILKANVRNLTQV